MVSMTETANLVADGSGIVRRVRTGVIVLAVPDLEEPYFAELTALLVRRAEERGLSVIIRQTDSSHAREVDVADGVGMPLNDGLIHIPRALTVADLTRRASPGPLVLLGEHIMASPFAHVTIDNRAAGMAATEHLLERGCSQVAVVGRWLTAPSDASNRRYGGYCDALAAHGIDVEPGLVGTVSAFTPAEGLRAMGEILDRGLVFDGVVCANDSVAFGVLSALQGRGLRVPDDVAVIGMDDVVHSRYTTPTLTTVSPDKNFMVERALAVLERQIATPPTADQPIEQVAVGFKIIERNSTRRSSVSSARGVGRLRRRHGGDTQGGHVLAELGDVPLGQSVVDHEGVDRVEVRDRREAHGSPLAVIGDRAR
jgi:DNA-binding LacI/PurR family transcriptional regulator